MIAILIFLFLVNIFPILGVILWEWDIITVLFSYWIETLVIGFFTLLKMIYSNVKYDKDYSLNDLLSVQYKLLGIPLFIFHFSVFSLGHLIIILVLFSNTTALSHIMKVFLTSMPVLILFLIGYWFEFQNFAFPAVSELTFTPYKRIIAMNLPLIIVPLLSRIFDYKLKASGLIFTILIKVVFDFWGRYNERW